MKIGEKVAYLKGLAEGLEISSDSKNGRILKGILDVLEDIAVSMQTLEDENETLEEYITEIDEDLGELETDFENKNISRQKVKSLNKNHSHAKKSLDNFTIEEGEDEDEDFKDFDGGEDEFDFDDDGKDIDDDEDEDENEENEILDGVVEIKCPVCGKHIFVETDELLDNDNIYCSKCGAEISIIDQSDVGSGCSCAHCAHSHIAGEGEESEGGDIYADDNGGIENDEELKF